MKTVLVVDDEKNYLLVLGTLLSEEGYNVVTCGDPRKAVKIAEEEQPQLVITDLKMPGLTGIELLKKVKGKRPDLPVIIMTAFGAVETAVEAMRHGAYHYILKPFQNEELKLVVKRAIEMNALAVEKGLLTEELSTRLGFEGFVFKSEAMREITNLIEQVATTRTTVLIQGESGTGKELVARTLHRRSPRSGRPFIAVNCGALTETLLESELFGHEKGAFTGADARRKGLFEVADTGTLFLDEISNTSPALQVKLLRVLQEQVFERVGGTRPIRVDVRIVAASNQDLAALIKEGRFREDLFYRLNVFEIKIPPLRERTEDILPLAEHFLKTLSMEMGKHIGSFSDAAVEALKRYHWPGNVREVRNVIERAVVVSGGMEISAADLTLDPPTPSQAAGGRTAVDLSVPLPELVDGYEKGLISEALKRSGGVQARAARLLGISPATLQYKLNKYGL
ncbi:MAG: sigma-54 dependent transcriptional regulator [Thermodesulfobacteriota bacterium]